MKYARFRVKSSDKVFSGQLMEDRVKNKAGKTFRLDQVTLLAPVIPGKIICVGKNYLEHAKEFGGDVPEKPLLFYKPPSALNDPESPIRLPASARVDYEGEIAVVIGKRCKDVPQAKAADVIWGYSCFNDVSDRQAQSWEGNWVRAKGFDTSACLGPVIATADELQDPIEVITRVNGELKQRGNSGQLAFSIPFLIETISAVMTLERGDVIATGTPGGVREVRDGDVLVGTIERVGRLEARVARREKV